MKKLILISMTVILILGLAESANAKNVITRLDPELIVKGTPAVAMAIETYDGEFFDLSEFKKTKKYKGNISDIIKKGYIEHSSGLEIDTNAIRYYFVQKKLGFKGKAPLPPSLGKLPSDEE